MTDRWPAAVLACATVLALLRCAAAAEPDPVDYFPLDVGWRWDYEVHKQQTQHLKIDPDTREPRVWEIEETVTRRIPARSPRFPRHRPVYRFVEDVVERNRTMGTTIEARMVRLVSRDDTRVLMHAQRFVGIRGVPALWQSYDEPPVLFDASPERDAVEPVDAHAFWQYTITSRFVESSIEAGSVEVPAGTFEDCLLVVSELTFEAPSQAEVLPWTAKTDVECTSWFAPGVGLVRQTMLIVAYRELPFGEVTPLFGADGGEWFVQEPRLLEFVWSETLTRELVSYVEGTEGTSGSPAP